MTLFYPGDKVVVALGTSARYLSNGMKTIAENKEVMTVYNVFSYDARTQQQRLYVKENNYIWKNAWLEKVDTSDQRSMIDAINRADDDLPLKYITYVDPDSLDL